MLILFPKIEDCPFDDRNSRYLGPKAYYLCRYNLGGHVWRFIPFICPSGFCVHELVAGKAEQRDAFRNEEGVSLHRSVESMTV